MVIINDFKTNQINWTTSKITVCNEYKINFIDKNGIIIDEYFSNTDWHLSSKKMAQ